MFAPVAQTHTDDALELRLPRPLIAATLVGLLFGTLLTLLLPHLTGLVALAMWPLGVAIGMVVVAFAGSRFYGQSLWGLLLGGQFIGAAAILLLLLASL